MTRGPLPKKAIDKAQDNAGKRGMVVRTEEMTESHHDFIIFGQACTIYIRIKRIRRHAASPEEIAEQFREDVRLIRFVPLTPVTAREIWTLSPWGCWQYFQILDDRIIEIHRDGTPVVPAESKEGKRPMVSAETKSTHATVDQPAAAALASPPPPSGGIPALLSVGMPG
jgi:hypothetical protein